MKTVSIVLGGILVIGLLIASSFMISYKWIDSGNVGVRVNASGSSRGVDPKPIGTGRAWYNPMFEEIHEFPVYEQNVRYTQQDSSSFTISSAQSAQIDVDVALTFQLDPEKVPALFAHLRKDIDFISGQWLKTHVREALSRAAENLPTMQILGEGKSELLDNAKKRLNADLKEYGIEIKTFTFGNTPRPEAKIQSSIDESIQAQQRATAAQNKILESKALADQEIEKSRGIAKGVELQAQANLIKVETEAKGQLIKAEAEAKANKVLAESITPELIKYQAIKGWDGALPKFGSGGFIPMVDLTDEVKTTPSK